MKNKKDREKGIKNSEKKKNSIDESVSLEDSISDEDPSTQFVFDPPASSPGQASKFFHHSPLSPDSEVKLLTPKKFSSFSAKQIQKEELWKYQISPNPFKKRPSSPGDDSERRMRSRSESNKGNQSLGSKLPFLSKTQ